MGDFVALLLRRKWLILVVALPVVGLSILYSYSRTPVLGELGIAGRR